MLPGFEQQTAKLSKYELEELVPLFVYGLSYRVGKDKAITASTMAEGIKASQQKKTGKLVNIAGARVRKIINYIRLNNLVPGLIGNANGYYITKDPEEFRSWLKSLEGRIRAEEALLKNGELYLMKLLNK